MQYYNYAESMRDVFLGSMRNVDYAIRGTSETITTQALMYQQNSTFPFVTLPMFEVQGEQYRRQSGIEAFLFTPFVLGQQQLEWEQYAQDHQGWLTWGRDFNLRNTEIAIRQPYLPGNVNPIIYQYADDDYMTKVPAVATATATADESESSLYAPIWLVRADSIVPHIRVRSSFIVFEYVFLTLSLAGFHSLLVHTTRTHTTQNRLHLHPFIPTISITTCWRNQSLHPFSHRYIVVVVVPCPARNRPLHPSLT
jgi:hypothetical protein